MLFSCDPVDNNLKISNKTKDTIYYAYTNNTYQNLYKENYEKAGIALTYLNYTYNVAPNGSEKQTTSLALETHGKDTCLNMINVENICCMFLI